MPLGAGAVSGLVVSLQASARDFLLRDVGVLLLVLGDAPHVIRLLPRADHGRKPAGKETRLPSANSILDSSLRT